MPSSAQAGENLARTAVFAPLDGVGRAELVERRLTDAIALGVLRDGERLPREADLARRFGVATVTAREALEALRHKGMLRTTRGREGGSFVTAGHRPGRQAIDRRIIALSRVELRDLATHYGIINAGAAELAAERVAPDDIDQLRAQLDRTDFTDPVAARRSEGAFHLELAALSQSARLVREEVRLQAEFGSLLWLSAELDSAACGTRAAHLEIIEALDALDGARARSLTSAHIGASLEWLVAYRATLEDDVEPTGDVDTGRPGSGGRQQAPHPDERRS